MKKETEKDREWKDRREGGSERERENNHLP